MRMYSLIFLPLRLCCKSIYINITCLFYIYNDVFLCVQLGHPCTWVTLPINLLINGTVHQVTTCYADYMSRVHFS